MDIVHFLRRGEAVFLPILEEEEIGLMVRPVPVRRRVSTLMGGEEAFDCECSTIWEYGSWLFQ